MYLECLHKTKLVIVHNYHEEGCQREERPKDVDDLRCRNVVRKVSLIFPGCEDLENLTFHSQSRWPLLCTRTLLGLPIWNKRKASQTWHYRHPWNDRLRVATASNQQVLNSCSQNEKYIPPVPLRHRLGWCSCFSAIAATTKCSCDIIGFKMLSYLPNNSILARSTASINR